MVACTESHRRQDGDRDDASNRLLEVLQIPCSRVVREDYDLTDVDRPQTRLTSGCPVLVGYVDLRRTQGGIEPGHKLGAPCAVGVRGKEDPHLATITLFDRHRRRVVD